MFMSQEDAETTHAVQAEEKPEEVVSEVQTEQKKPGVSLQSVESDSASGSSETSSSEQKPPRPKGKPSLKVIK